MDVFSSVSSDKKIGGIGAFYYEGKKMTTAHLVNFIRMKKMCDITYLVIFYTGDMILDDNEINSLAQKFMLDNQDILVDYVYFDRDVFKIPKKQKVLMSEIEDTPEWKWFAENTDIINIFSVDRPHPVYIQSLLNIISFPRETERIGKLIDNQLLALSGKNVTWFRGICDYINELRTVAKFVYPSFSSSDLYEQYKKTFGSLYAKRIYLPVVSLPTGRVIHNTHLLGPSITSGDDHIFVKIKRDFDVSKSTIEQFKDFVSNNLGRNTFSVYNFAGKSPTTDDLKNKNVFLNVFDAKPDFLPPEVDISINYEPGGETMWVGSSENDIYEVDYLTGKASIKTISGLEEPEILMREIFTNNNCYSMDIKDIFSVLNAHLYNYYKK